MVRVKICGLTRQAVAEAAQELGADYLGFNFEPGSPRFLGDTPPEWIFSMKGPARRVAVFGRFRPSVGLSEFDFVQAADWEGNFISRPTISVMRLQAGQTMADVLANHSSAMLLLDAWREGAYGGTGHRVDWDLAAEIVAKMKLPVMLAGGLTPENVADAVVKVRPYAVDVSSGVEASKGVKDIAKIRDFIAAAKSAV